MDFFTRFMENFNFFWKNKYGESDLNIVHTLIRNVEASLLRIAEQHKHLQVFWARIDRANEVSARLLETGQDTIAE